MGKQTDELRRLLDWRGMHWMEIEHPNPDIMRTCWKPNDNRQETYCYFEEHDFGDFSIGDLLVSHVTPEQAVIMTLGRTAKPIIVSNGTTGHCECEACGKTIDPWDAYCRHCGAKIATWDESDD